MKKILILLILLPFILDAQIVNIENKRFYNDSIKFAGKISSRINFIKNASSITDIGNNIVLQYQKTKNRLIFANDINFLKVSNTPTAVNTGYSHIRYQRRLNKYISLEEFFQYQYNKPLKIEHQFLVGSGVRLKIPISENVKTNSGVAFMYQFQNSTITYRVSLYASVYATIKNVNISNIIYYQPCVVRIANYRILDEMQFQFNINKHIGYGLVCQYVEDSEHADGIPRQTYRLLNQLTLNW